MVLVWEKYPSRCLKSSKQRQLVFPKTRLGIITDVLATRPSVLLRSFTRSHACPKDPGTPRRRTKRQRLQCCIWAGNRLMWIVPGSFPCRWRKRVSSGRVKSRGEPRRLRTAFMGHLFQGSPLFSSEWTSIKVVNLVVV